MSLKTLLIKVNLTLDQGQTLQTINCQPTFLKGAAYVLDKTSNHEGRVMTDIDILVYKDDLALVETTLKR